MTPLDMGGLCAAIAAGSVVCGYLWGRQHTPEPPDDDFEDRLNQAYDEGWEDALAEAEISRQAAESGRWPSRAPEMGWQQTMALELAPEHLDAEAEQLSLPGPQASTQSADWASNPRAGEFHSERPLPVILHLGDEFDGSTGTFSRVELRQFQMRTEYDRGQAAFCREMGIEYRSPWQEAA
jgi:hypothetical protein